MSTGVGNQGMAPTPSTFDFQPNPMNPDSLEVRQGSGRDMSALGGGSAQPWPNPASTPSTSWDTPNVGATAPAPISAFGPTPSVTPTYTNPALTSAPQAPNAYQASAATVDPNQNRSYMDQYAALVGTELAPQFKSQDQALQEQSAARGLTGGAAQYFANDLAGKQAATFAGAVAPIVQQGYGYTQQDIQGNQAATNTFSLSNQNAINSLLSQGYSYEQAATMANQGNTQQANLFNANTANNTSKTNADYYGSALSADYNSYNHYLDELLNLGAGNFSGLESAYLNSFGPSTGVSNAYGSTIGGVGNTFGSVASGAATGGGAALGGLFSGAGAAVAGAGAASDRRLKRDIEPVGDPIAGLQPVRFIWRASGSPDTGFIAQDVQKIRPDLVVDMGAGILGLNYAKITAILLEHALASKAQPVLA